MALGYEPECIFVSNYIDSNCGTSMLKETLEDNSASALINESISAKDANFHRAPTLP